MSTGDAHPKPEILAVELTDDPAPAVGEFAPTRLYNPRFAEIAGQRIGRTAYAILRTQAFGAVGQLRGSFDTLLKGLEYARGELADAVRDGQLTQSEADAQFDERGRALHWQVVLTLGVVVEHLVAMLVSHDAYRAGSQNLTDVFLTTTSTC